MVVLFFHRFGCLVSNQTHVPTRGHWPLSIRPVSMQTKLREICLSQVWFMASVCMRMCRMTNPIAFETALDARFD